MTRISLFFDKTREPLRRRVYTALIPLVALLVGTGYLTNEISTSILGLASALLIGGSTEFARSAVTPTADPLIDDEPGAHAA